MKEIERGDDYIIYQFDDVMEYIEHYQDNFKYLSDMFINSDGKTCIEYDIGILGEDSIPSFFTPSSELSWINAIKNANIDIDKVKSKVQEETNQTTYDLALAALYLNDKKWFMELTNKI